jgi:hypothetical protein
VFIEVTVDAQGQTLQGWCADTAPEDLSRPLFTNPGGDPPNTRRVRLELTTTEQLEIEDRAKEIAAAVAKDLLDQGRVDQAAHELANFKRHRLAVLVRDLEIDLTGPPVPPPRGADAPGIEFRKPKRIKDKPPVVTGTQGPP